MSLEKTTDKEVKKLQLLNVDVKKCNKNVQFYVRHLLAKNFGEVHEESREDHPIEDLDEAADMVYAVGDKQLNEDIRHYWSLTKINYIGTIGSKKAV